MSFYWRQRLVVYVEGYGLSQHLGGEDRDDLLDKFGWWIRRFLLRLGRTSNARVFSSGLLDFCPSFTRTNYIIV